jgi:positive regulator of sigma E activity
MPSSLIVYVFYLVALVVCGLAYWVGDRPLRLTALVLIVGWAFTPMIVHLDKHGLNLPVAIVDIAAAAIFVWISMRSRRVWCAVVAALSIIPIAIRFVAAADPDIHNYNRAASNNVVMILELVVMVIATWLAARARRRADEGAVRS